EDHHDDAGHGAVRHHRQHGRAGHAARAVRAPGRSAQRPLCGGPGAGRCRTVTLELFLLVAAALLCVGLFGALTQQSVVMLMMGLELMIGGVILAAAALWHYTAPFSADGQVLVIVAVTAMAL